MQGLQARVDNMALPKEMCKASFELVVHESASVKVVAIRYTFLSLSAPQGQVRIY